MFEDEIIENFSYPKPSERCYIITGERGSGKTALISKISKRLKKQGDCIIYNLSLDGNVIKQFKDDFSSVEKTGKKILIILEDVFVCDEMAAFAKMFQFWITGINSEPVYLIMSATYENYKELTDMNDERLKGCQFLLRALERKIYSST